ncbi:MAG: phage tail protein [Dethiobacteria bacterium]
MHCGPHLALSVGQFCLLPALLLEVWRSGTNTPSPYRKQHKLLSPADLAKGFRDLEQSTQKSADATEDQADALGKAGKAAGKNLQSFDEIHQLQGDMAGSAEDMALDVPELEDIGIPGLPDMDLEGMVAGIEPVKGTLSGFWEWIKEQAGNVWEGVKQKWSSFVEWVTGWSIWSWIGEKWESFKVWAGGFWEGVKNLWSSFVEWIKGWSLWEWIGETWSNFVSWAGNIWDGIKDKWSIFKKWAGDMWEGAKGKWGNFTDWVQKKWSNFKTKASEIWEGVKANVEKKWEALKTNAPIIWENIKKEISDRWENLKNSASEKWGNIKTTISEKWEALKTEAPNTWENIKKEISNRWNTLKTNASTIWENIRKTISNKWDALKKNAPTTWGSIKTTIEEKWEGLKNSVGPAWNSIKTVIEDKWQEIKNNAFNWGRNIISSFTDGIKDRISKIKTTFSSVAGTIKDYLGFSSPTKEGPGRYADRWAPNLMKMYSKGLTSNISMMQDAASATIRDLAELDIGGATITGKQAGISPPAFTPTPTASGDMTVIVKIGEDTIMEKIISNINRKIPYQRGNSNCDLRGVQEWLYYKSTARTYPRLLFSEYRSMTWILPIRSGTKKATCRGTASGRA